MNTLQRFAPVTGRGGRASASASARWPGMPATVTFDTGSLLKADRPRPIDRYIDYFGTSGPGHHVDPSSHSETGREADRLL